MGLFDKKICDICGNKIGLLGNRKLEDGNCCKDCAKKLSPWFDERRHSTVAQIKDQLAYREDNRQALAVFNTTRTFGESYQLLYIDEGARKFTVAGSGKFKDENPDVVDFSQVTSVNLDVKHTRKELKQRDAQGKEISFNPPRYEYEYDFYIVIRVNNPWFSEMRFKLNLNKLVIQEMGAVKRGLMITQTTFDPHMSYEYQNYEQMANEITDILQRSSNASFAEGLPSEWRRLEMQAEAASKEGKRDAAISLYKQSIRQGGQGYCDLLMELQNKVAEPTSTDRDVQDLMEWAKLAKDAGYEAGHFIGLAQRIMTIRKMGVGPEVPWGEQLVLIMKIAEDELREAAGDQFPTMSQEEALDYIENSEEMAEFRRKKKLSDIIMSGATAEEALEAMKAETETGGSWTCSCCGSSNSGKFCENCGSPRP